MSGLSSSGRGTKSNLLFSGGADCQLNACVGRNGGPYDYSHYAEGYFIAAERLMESLSESNRHIDVLVYPIAFNLRHGVELSLKHLGQILPRICDERAPVRFTHLLHDNWQQVRGLLMRDEQFDPEKDLVEKMDGYIENLLLIDPRGEVFRYPVSKGGALHLEDQSLINIEILFEALQEMRKIFDWWAFSAGYVWDAMRDSY